MTSSFALSYLLACVLVGYAMVGGVRARAADETAAGGMLMYVGTYTGKNSKGIYAYRLDLSSGKLTPAGLAAETANPTYLALHPSRRFLYAANEIGRFEGKPVGAVSAFAVDAATGKLTLLNQKSSGGSGPCHLQVDQTGKSVLVANYGGGSIAALPVNADGRLGEPACVIQHKGSSVNPQRQEGPHAHGIYLDGANRLALVADLGLDKLLIYRFDAVKSRLTPHDPAFGSSKPGAGPRHLAFHPNGRFVYAIHELDNTIVAYSYDAALGKLAALQSVPTLPEDFKGTSYTAEIFVHPSGKYLYGSNRGHESLVVFAIDPQNGELKRVQHQSTLGKTPRGFGIDPTGAFLVAGNQTTDDMFVFRIDAQSGRLTPTGQRIEVGAPVCIQFVE